MVKIKGWDYLGKVGEHSQVWKSKTSEKWVGFNKVISNKLISNQNDYWVVMVTTPKGILFEKEVSTKSQALKYVKNYMRRHPNG